MRSCGGTSVESNGSSTESSSNNDSGRHRFTADLVLGKTVLASPVYLVLSYLRQCCGRDPSIASVCLWDWWVAAAPRNVTNMAHARQLQGTTIIPRPFTCVISNVT
jgi:hypothetical protein